MALNIVLYGSFGVLRPSAVATFRMTGKEVLNAFVYKTYSFKKSYFSIHFTAYTVHIFYSFYRIQSLNVELSFSHNV